MNDWSFSPTHFTFYGRRIKWQKPSAISVLAKTWPNFAKLTFSPRYSFGPIGRWSEKIAEILGTLLCTVQCTLQKLQSFSLTIFQHKFREKAILIPLIFYIYITKWYQKMYQMSQTSWIIWLIYLAQKMSWADHFRFMSWAEPSWREVSISWAELSWAGGRSQIRELSWAELAQLAQLEPKIELSHSSFHL